MNALWYILAMKHSINSLAFAERRTINKITVKYIVLKVVHAVEEN